jgi:hypothetical protein
MLQPSNQGQFDVDSTIDRLRQLRARSQELVELAKELVVTSQELLDDTRKRRSVPPKDEKSLAAK